MTFGGEVAESMAVVLFWTFIHSSDLRDLIIFTLAGWFCLFLIYQYGSYL